MQFIWSNVAESTFYFVSSQVWSEHRMQTTSWDQCPVALQRRRTSPLLSVTSHTSSTRVMETPIQSRPITSFTVFRKDLLIHLITNQDYLPQLSLCKFIKVPAMLICMTKVMTQVMEASWSMESAAVIAVITDMGESRGSTSVGEGRNVCKGTFLFNFLNQQHSLHNIYCLEKMSYIEFYICNWFISS